MLELKAILEMAQEAVRALDTERAVAILEEVKPQFSENSQWCYALANLYRKNKNFEFAHHYFEKVAPAYRHDPDFWHHYGLLYYAEGRMALAEEKFRQALALKTDFIEAMYNLALALYAQNKKEEAMASLFAITEAAPLYARAYFLLGKIALEAKRYEVAANYFQNLTASFKLSSPDSLIEILNLWLSYDRFIEAKPYAEKLLLLRPKDTELRYNLAVIETRLGSIDKAINYYQQVLRDNPRHFASLNNLGVLYLQQQSIETAKYYFEKALQERPDSESLQYTLGAITGDCSHQQAPQTYISNLFNSYAGHFDLHAKQALEYCTPELLKSSVASFFLSPPTALNILDLGCGTGLCGALFKSWSQRLIGVDLAANMLAKAKEKNIYDTLILDENVHYLQHTPKTFDLITAADVLVYQGELEPIFQAAYKALVSNGLFAFSLEYLEDDQRDFVLQPSGRFAHSEKYIKRLAQKTHFEILSIEVLPTRRQRNNWVYGYCCIFKAIGERFS